MALDKFTKFLIKIFGSRNERLVKGYMSTARAAAPYEEPLRQLSDEALKAKTAEFKAALADGQRPDEILPEAFAVVREAARRTVNMRHFDVQLIGGQVLYEGKIAEMATGEGKTLVATLAVYLVHLTGRHVHVVTVNDYLAKRDAEWMGPIYQALGMTVGAIQADMDTSGRGAEEPVRVRRHLRHQQRVRLRLPPRQHEDLARPDGAGAAGLRDRRRGGLDSDRRGADAADHLRSGVRRCHAATRRPTRWPGSWLSLQSAYDRIKSQIDAAEAQDRQRRRAEVAEAKREKDNARAREGPEEPLPQAQAELEAATREAGADDRSITRWSTTASSVHLTHEGETAAQDIAGVGSLLYGRQHGLAAPDRAEPAGPRRLRAGQGLRGRWTARSSSSTSSPAG